MNKEEHKDLGIQFFNQTWDFIDNDHKTQAEKMQLIDLAHGSKLHWVLSEPPMINIVRADWLISHAYAHLDFGGLALSYAKICLEQTLNHKIKDFDLVFAYEAMARAYKILGDVSLCQAYLDKAYEAVKGVEKKEDKVYCISELDALKD